MRRNRKLSLLNLYLALTLPLCAAFAAIDSPEALESTRQNAMQLIQSGQRLEAARLLLDTLSALPKDRADLALSAIGAVQLLMFTNEYLMTDTERQALYSGSLDEKNNEMHRFLATLMRYLDDSGISQKEADECALDLYELTNCEHLPVRLGALFVMSDPYYFYDSPLAWQARDQIVAEFPGAYLAQEAQRLPLYYARIGGAKGLKQVLERTTDEGKLRADTGRTRADRVGNAIYDAVKGATPELADTACVASLAAAARAASDWAEEYAALNIAEGFHGTARAPQVRAAATEAIERNRDPRCMFRARVVRMSVARNQGDTEAVLEDADALLKLEDVPVVPDRNNYEELKNSIQQSADYLAEINQPEAARSLLERLAARFPNTTLAAKLAEKVAAIAPAATEGNEP